MRPEAPPCPPHAHRMRYRVPYAETDRMGRVYYANFLVWFERGRTELLRADGLPYADLEAAGVFLPVRHCEIRYLSHALYDEELVFATWVTRLRRMSVSMATAVLRQPDVLLAYGTVDLACVGADGRPRAFPAEAAAVLRARLPEAGSAAGGGR